MVVVVERVLKMWILVVHAWDDGCGQVGFSFSIWW
jgi:hypothetical protein